MIKKDRERLFAQGEVDWKAGKPIDAYYDMALPVDRAIPSRHTERARGVYGMGYRYARDEAARECRRARKNREAQAFMRDPYDQ